MKNQILKNKNLYKITIICIKYLPSILAFIQIIGTFINYFGIALPCFGLIGGTSLIFLGLMYLLSYLFQYCYLYRIPLGYSAIMNILIILRVEGILNLDLLILYRIFMLIAGIFISIFVFLMYKNRNNPKVGGIKHFCEKYCDC